MTGLYEPARVLPMHGQKWAPVHPQVQTSRGVLVDEKIAPLLEALWEHDLTTQCSCQGERMGYICFDSVEAAEVFVGRSRSVNFRIQGRFVDVPSDAIDYLTDLWGHP